VRCLHYVIGWTVNVCVWVGIWSKANGNTPSVSQPIWRVLYDDVSPVPPLLPPRLSGGPATSQPNHKNFSYFFCKLFLKSIVCVFSSLCTIQYSVRVIDIFFVPYV
jgi:hypothetical protein